MSYPWDNPMLDDDDDDDYPPEIEPAEEPEEEDDKPAEKRDTPGSMDDKLLKNRTILIYGETVSYTHLDVYKRQDEGLPYCSLQ